MQERTGAKKVGDSAKAEAHLRRAVTEVVKAWGAVTEGPTPGRNAADTAAAVESAAASWTPSDHRPGDTPGAPQDAQDTNGAVLASLKALLTAAAVISSAEDAILTTGPATGSGDLTVPVFANGVAVAHMTVRCPRPGGGAVNRQALEAVALAVGAALQLAEIEARWAETLVEAARQERRRIARDLHDGVVQEATAVSLQVAAAATLDANLAPVAEGANRTVRDLRGAVSSLRGHADGDGGPDGTPLLAALRRLARDAERRRPGTQVHLRIFGSARELSPERSRELLNIGREALNNALRHSGADAVEVVFRAHPGWVELSVRDDGNGFHPSRTILTERAETGGFGLQGMRERAATIGARVHVFSRRGHGTLVKVVLKSN